MLSAPPPPTPIFATLTLTPARAWAAGYCHAAAGSPGTRAGTRRRPDPEATAARWMPAEGAGYSPMNGEIYRHEVLGEADPRPCDLKTVTASRVRMARAQTGTAGGGQAAECGHWASAVPLPETAPLPAASAERTELRVLHRARGPTKSPGSRIYRGGGGARPREAPPSLAHSWNNVTKIMNGFGACRSCGPQLGGALGSAPRGPCLLQLLVRAPPPPAHDSYSQTRAWIRARAHTHERTGAGVQCQCRLELTSQPA